MLDLRTIFAISVLVNAFLCVAMVVFWRCQKTYPGFGFWVVCNAAVALTYLSYGVRGLVPDWSSIAVANLGVAVAVIMRLQGVRLFCGHRLLSWPLLAIYPVALTLWCLWFIADHYVRGMTHCLTLGLFTTWIAWILWVRGQEKSLAMFRAVALFIFFQGLLLLGRVVHWWLVPEARNLMVSTPGNVAFFVAMLICDVGLTQVYLLLNSSLLAEELGSSRKLAEAANEAKSRFLATMSHEIRTPMNAVVGFLDLLEHGLPTDEQRTLANQARDAGRHLVDLIDDALDLSRIEASQMVLASVPLDPRELTASVVGTHAPQAALKGLKLDHVVSEDVPGRLLGDPTRLRQVLYNLIGNGLKFTERGGVRVTVSRAPTPGPHPRLRFEVIDTGVGIAVEHRERLFKPFNQADDSISRRYGGSGLGLAISRRIVERMGGQIGFDSEPGRGSVFFFEVTLAEAPADQGDEVPEVPLRSTPAQLAILLVDDVEFNRMVQAAMLRRLGFECDLADGGTAAVRACAARRYDLVFMDCHMPEVDGFEATRLIRTAETGGHRAGIIALSADVLSDTPGRCRDAGMDDYLAKPLTLDVLGQFLRSWRGGGRTESG
ncbi:MAG: response regulator [Candidatus Riflebacteria bacterium]|nr:response regulator [Candidatus Riflebacteria bacterium]